MSKLYRFRRCNDYSLNALFENGIQGSKYCAMADPKEVSITVNIEEIRKITKLDKALIDKTAEVIRDHIINSYYIACFTAEDETDEMGMWRDYANSNGFCLVYNESSIIDAMRLSMSRGLPVFHILKRVDYGDKPTDITPFVKNYLRLVGDDLENEDRHRIAASQVGESLTAEERERIINAMFHKIGKFTEKTEKRIVSLKENNDSVFCNDILGVPVKPIEIICSSLMPRDVFYRIRKFTIMNHIKLSIKEIAV